MPKEKPSWTEKLHDSKDLPKVEIITEKMSKRWGTGTVVIPAPIEVDGLMKKVPTGKVTTINEIRVALAKKTQHHHWLPHDHRHFRLDFSARGRGATPTWSGKHHALLAYAQNRWTIEREISWRRHSATTFFGRRRTHGGQKGKNYAVFNYEASLIVV